MYTYKAELVRVVDADTVDLFVDVGFKVQMLHRIRLLRVDAPERYTPHGRALTQLVKDWFESNKGSQVIVQTQKADSFGRYLGEIFLQPSDGELSLNDELLKQPHVKEWGK